MILEVLLLQVATGLAGEVASHPYVFLSIASGFLVVISTLIGYIHRDKTKVISQLSDNLDKTTTKVNDVESHLTEKINSVEQQFSKRVSGIETSLEQYKEHVGAGDEALRVLTARIEKHMAEEERLVWDGMGRLEKAVSDLKVENIQAHGDIIAGRTTLIERMTAVETRVQGIERKMPNGEFSRVIQLLSELVADQDRRYNESPRDEATRIRPKKRK